MQRQTRQGIRNAARSFGLAGLLCGVMAFGMGIKGGGCETPSASAPNFYESVAVIGQNHMAINPPKTAQEAARRQAGINSAYMMGAAQRSTDNAIAGRSQVNVPVTPDNGDYVRKLEEQNALLRRMVEQKNGGNVVSFAPISPEEREEMSQSFKYHTYFAYNTYEDTKKDNVAWPENFKGKKSRYWRNEEVKFGVSYNPYDRAKGKSLRRIIINPQGKTVSNTLISNAIERDSITYPGNNHDWSQFLWSNGGAGWWKVRYYLNGNFDGACLIELKE